MKVAGRRGTSGMRTLLAVLLLAVPALAQRRHPRPPAPTPPRTEPRGPVRIELDPQAVIGQRNAYGAVELYERKQLVPRSMVKTPESFRDEISL
jgi:hypothetical protein